MKKMFEEVIKLDAQINEACENGNEELEKKLYNEQIKLVKKIEDMGFEAEFDKFIESL